MNYFNSKEMKTTEELKQLFSSDLQYELEPLEKKRKAFLSNFLLLTFLFLAMIIMCVLFFPVAKYLIGIVLLIWGFSVLRKKYRTFKETFAVEFKKDIISKLTLLIDEELNYHPEYGLSEETFIRSGVVRGSVDWFRSEDYFEGTIGETQIYFSEVHAKTKQKDHETGGESYYDLFKGILFAADFNKSVSSRIVVFPDIFQGRLGALGDKLLKTAATSEKAEIVKLEDTEFERFFTVFSNDQVEARYVLTPSLMKRILDFRKKYKHFSISFIDNHIYIGLFINKNLFEPRIFHKVTDVTIMENYLQYIQLTIDLVEDLNMNTRIWKTNTPG